MTVQINVLKFKNASAIKVGDHVNVHTYCHYGITSEANIVSMIIDSSAAHKVEFIANGSKERFVMWVQARTPAKVPGMRVKTCSVYGEVVAIEDGVLIIKDENINF